MGTGWRRGRRDNGLEAAEYAVAGDVDPRVGEHLLDVLAASGIAAYLQPAADLHPITRTTTMPARPTDRLYVDRAHVATARGYLAELAETPASPEAKAGPTVTPVPAAGAGGAPVSDPGTGTDIDTAWARIVAELRADLDPATSSWPDRPTTFGGGGHRPADQLGAPAEHRADERAVPADDERRPAADQDGPTADQHRPGDRTHRPGDGTQRPGDDRGPAEEPSLLDALDTFGAGLPDEDEGSYTPPLPPPLPRLSKSAVAAVLAVLAGFTLFIWPELVPIGADVTRFTGFLACFAGVAALIWRLRPGDDEDEARGPDDGAVV